VAALETEFCINGKIFTALRTLLKNEHLVTAGGAEFGIPGDILPTVRAVDGLRRRGLPCGCGLECLGEHGGHHKPHPHAQTRARLSLGLGGRFHGHGGFHLEKFVEIVKDAEPALVVDGLLDFRRRCDRVDLQLVDAQTKTGKIFFDGFFQAF
jgi:hypothetical protein